jgi:hypothetical protein
LRKSSSPTFLLTQLNVQETTRENYKWRLWAARKTETPQSRIAPRPSRKVMAHHLRDEHTMIRYEYHFNRYEHYQRTGKRVVEWSHEPYGGCPADLCQSRGLDAIRHENTL